MNRVRIQKLLAAAGVASRRRAEDLILEGRVTVNGRTVADLPCFVDTDADEVRVDGRRVGGRAERKTYILLNKPRGVVCTHRDPEGRPRAVDLVPGAERLHCVGRLDVEGTGLILLTNDGELTNHLTHPRYGVVKTYVAEVEGLPGVQAMAALREGTWLDGRRTEPAGVSLLRRSVNRSLLEIRLRESRGLQIRRVLARLGHKVRRLKRVAIGPLTDRGLKIGHFRFLRPEEVARLRANSGGGRASARSGPAPRRTQGDDHGR